MNNKKIVVETVSQREVKDLTGQRFGKLTVLNERKSGSAKTNIKWMCQCDCGVKKWVTMPCLITGRTTSCGCSRINSKNRLSYLTAKQPENGIIGKYIHAAKKRKLEWNLAHEDLMKLLKGNCFYCGAIPSQVKNDFVYNGIDRVDNDKGYLKDNVVSCCGICNQGKSNMKLSEFYEWINKVKTTRNL